jgi:hypothetical protein
MRHILLFIFIHFATLSYSQDTTATVETDLADSGKNEFKFQAKKDTSDYTNAYRILMNQVKLNPTNAELRYFLGYAIDRLNADDGKQMFQLKKNLSQAASEQFEEVNRLTPIYKGEILLLDPYGKLTSIWGSLAEAYLNKNLPDSAKWAFTEGKKRGGFIEPVLDFNRQLINSCDKNAILVTYGDNITIPLWYLQVVENYRTDVIVVDANLINTTWYPKYLKNEMHLKMSFTDAAIDTINYELWQPQDVTVINPTNKKQHFSWQLKPTYMENYILKGDRILLDIIQQNFYNKPIYFNSNSDSSYNLFLSDYLLDEGLVHRITTKILDYRINKVAVPKQLYLYNIDHLNENDILKSKDAIIVLNYFRWAYYNSIYHLIIQGNYNGAKELINTMTEKFKKNKLPFVSAENEKYFIDLFSQINKDYH